MDKIKDIIPQVISHISLGEPDKQDKIRQAWQKALNVKTTQHAAVVGFQKEQLIVHVDSPAWLFQMNLKKRKILEEVKKAVPEISDIRFKIGKVK